MAVAVAVVKAQVQGVAGFVAVGPLLGNKLQLLEVYHTHVVMRASLESYSSN